MTNAFGGFHHKSPFPTHLSCHDFASSCIRDHFGPTVQTVADALHSRGPGSTLLQILTAIKVRCKRLVNADRERLVSNVGGGTIRRNGSGNNDGPLRLNETLGSEEHGYVVDGGAVRAALLVLIHHSIVRVETPPPPCPEEEAALAVAAATQAAVGTTDTNMTTSKGEEGAKKSTLPGKKSLTTAVKAPQYRYHLDHKRATLLPRYPRYIDYVRRTVSITSENGPSMGGAGSGGGAGATASVVGGGGEAAAAILENVLVNGRMVVLELVICTIGYLRRERGGCDEGGVPNDDVGDPIRGGKDVGGVGCGIDNGGEDATRSTPCETVQQRVSLCREVVRSLRELVSRGLLEMIDPITRTTANMTATMTIMNEEWEQQQQQQQKQQQEQKQKKQQPTMAGVKREYDETINGCPDDDGIGIGNNNHNNNINDTNYEDQDDTTIVRNLLSSPPYRRLFPPGSVWRTNVRIFHRLLRALSLGRLVSERYGHKVPDAGSLVAAALRFAAHRENLPIDGSGGVGGAGSGGGGGGTRPPPGEEGIFSPDDIVRYLPPAVQDRFKSRAGGVRSNVSVVLQELCGFSYPTILTEVEDAAGHPLGGKFEVMTTQLVRHLRGRVVHGIVREHRGIVASRICALLEVRGRLESDAIADGAMVPAKDVREIIHTLYKDNYVTITNLQLTKNHNPQTAIYLWGVSHSRLLSTVLGNIIRVMHNLRLRRQHEVGVGREWIERAKEAGESDENDSELDKIKYEKFCRGLERLDDALLRLDETLMILRDFL